MARVREPAERLGATQFEIVTAAALAAFADAGVDVAVVEAGPRRPLDATNVLRRASSCSRTSASSTPTSSATRARGDRDARSSPSRRRTRSSSSRRDVRAPRPRPRDPDRRRAGGGRGVRRPRDRRDPERRAPGPARARDGESGTVRTIPTVRATWWSSSTATTTRSWPRSSRTRTSTRCSRSFVGAERALVATRRRPHARFLRRRPRRPCAGHFDHVEVVDDPVAALASAHELGEPVLVTGLALPARRSRQAEQHASWRG